MHRPNQQDHGVSQEFFGSAIGLIKMVASSAVGGALLSGGAAIAKKMSQTAKAKATGPMMMTSVLKQYVIEPIFIVSKEAWEDDNIAHILDFNLNVFVAYYLQAFQVLKMQGYDVLATLDLLATNSTTNTKTRLGNLVSKTARAAGVSVLNLEDQPKDYLRELFSTEALDRVNSRNFEMSVGQSVELPLTRHKNAKFRVSSSSDVVTVREAGANRFILTANKPGTCSIYTVFDSKGKVKKKNAAGPTFDITVSKTVSQSVKDIASDIASTFDSVFDAIEKGLDYGAKGSLKGSSDIEQYKDMLVRVVNLQIKKPGSSEEFNIPITIQAKIYIEDIETIIDQLVRKEGNTPTVGSDQAVDVAQVNNLINGLNNGKFKDEDSLLTELDKREKSAKAKLVDSGGYGFEASFNMVVVSNPLNGYPESAKLSQAIDGDITKNNVMDYTLKHMNCLSMTIMDPSRENIMFKVFDIGRIQIIRYKDLIKQSNQDPNYSALMTSMLTGRGPVL